jgi:hypothetical protein
MLPLRWKAGCAHFHLFAIKTTVDRALASPSLLNREGQTLGEFEILARLGHGGMGAVYKAWQIFMRRLLAFKTLQPALASDAECIARFHREAEAAASLSHQNLVQVFSAGESEGLHLPSSGDAAMAVMLKHVTAPVPSLRSAWPECPEELARVVMKMMLKQPGARQQSHAEVLADLRRAHDALTGATAPMMAAGPQQSLKKRLPATALAGGAFVLVAAIAALRHVAPQTKGVQHPDPGRAGKFPVGEVWRDWIAEREKEGNGPKEFVREAGGYRVVAGSGGGISTKWEWGVPT